MTEFDINKEILNTKSAKRHRLRNFNILIKRITLVLLIIVIVVAGGIIYAIKYMNDPNKLTIGYSNEDTFALISLSKQKGFFEKNNVVEEYRKYKTDEKVLEAFSKNKIDIAIVEDIEFVMTLPSENSERILASICSADSYFYILDGKKGLFDVGNLIGKSLGKPSGSGIDYWLNNMITSKKELSIKEIKAKNLAKDFANAKVDAILAKQPFVYQTEHFAKTEVQGIKISAQGEKRSNTIIVSKEDFIEKNKDTLRNFLKSLKEAEEYYTENPIEAKEVLISSLGLEKEYFTEISKDYEYKLLLNQKFKDDFRTKYEWKVQKKRSSSIKEFDLEKVYYYPLLREVKPEVVEF